MATRTHLIEKGVAVLRHAMISAHAYRESHCMPIVCILHIYLNVVGQSQFTHT